MVQQEEGPRIEIMRDGVLLGTVRLAGPGHRWLIGRSAEADLVVNHPHVSRQHAAIHEEDGAYYVTDLGSAHGTKVMGQSIAADQPFRLFDGLSITVGGAARELVPRGTVAAVSAAVAAAARAQAEAARRAEQDDDDNDMDEDLVDSRPQPARGGNAAPSAAHAMGAALLSRGGGAGACRDATAAAAELAAQEGEDEQLRALFPMQLGKASRGAFAPSLEAEHAAFARRVGDTGGGAEGAPTAGVAGNGRGRKSKGQKLKMAPKLGATLGTGLNVAAASPTLVALQKSRAEAAAAEAAAVAEAARKSKTANGGGKGARGGGMPPPPPRKSAQAMAPSRQFVAAGREGGKEEGKEEEAEEDEVGPPLPPHARAHDTGEGADGSDGEEVGPPLPPEAHAGDTGGEGSDDEVGPPLPPGMPTVAETVSALSAGGGGSSSDEEVGPAMPPGFGMAAGAEVSVGGRVGAETGDDGDSSEDESGPQLPSSGGNGAVAAMVDASLMGEVPPDFGPQLPPGISAGGTASGVGTEARMEEEPADFGPQLPIGIRAGGTGAGIPAGGYDPDDLSLQVYDADAGGGAGAAGRRRQRKQRSGGGGGERAAAAGGGGGEEEAIASVTRHYPGLGGADSDSEDGDNDGDNGEYEDAPALPVSHQIALSAHTKTVTSLAVDKAGARIITGGSDSDVYFWDFAGMTRELRPFRHIERPLGAYQVRSLDFSPSAHRVLVCGSSTQPVILDRNGRKLATLMKGDMYIRDMRHTKGHVAACTAGKWHPTDINAIATASEDGTVRLWDVEIAMERGDDASSLNVNGGQRAVYVLRDSRGIKTACTAAAWAPGGDTLMAGGRDGSLQLWEVRAKAYQPVMLAARAVPRSESIADATRPVSAARAAHAPGTDVTCVRWKSDGRMLASRSTDGTLKLWDIRRFDAPVAEWGELPALHPMTGADFSPDESLLVTGTSVQKGTGKPTLDFFSTRTMSRVAKLEVDGAAVVPLLWHPRINQILLGNGDGKAYALYDPTLSEKGAMLCSVKAAPKRGMLSYMGEGFSQAMHIVTPHALPMFRQENDDHRKKRKLDRKDPLKSRKPEQVLTGPGTGGKLSVSYQQALLASMSGGISGLGGTRDKIDKFKTEDPREELLKYAKMAEENPVFVSPAYTTNQPVGADPTAGTYPKFAKTVEPEDEERDSD